MPTDNVVMTPNADLEVGADDEDDKEVFNVPKSIPSLSIELTTLELPTITQTMIHELK